MCAIRYFISDMSILCTLDEYYHEFFRIRLSISNKKKHKERTLPLLFLYMDVNLIIKEEKFIAVTFILWRI